MYQPGEYVIYGGEGVCRVEAIGPAPVSGMGEGRQYYTLRPVYHSGTVYAPVDGAVLIRRPMSKKEASELISGIPNLPTDYGPLPPAKQTAAEYKTWLQTYDPANLLRLIRMIYFKNVSAIAQNKGYGQTDDRFMKKAKELLYGELAMALDISVNEVEQAIVRAVE